MTNYIAEFKAPKQRITRPFGYVIKQGDQPDEYTVARKYYDEMGGYDRGSYNLSYDQAAEEFAKLVQYHVTHYPPEVFDTCTAGQAHTPNEHGQCDDCRAWV